MIYKKAYVLVEGYTEERFVKEILKPYFEDDFQLIPTIITTSKNLDGSYNKGGSASYKSFKNQILKLLKDPSCLFVTTFLDYYALNNDFPGKNNLNDYDDCYSRIEHLEKSLLIDINNNKFIPYLQLHEFESFLFVEPSQTVEKLLNPMSNLLDELDKIKTKFLGNPELINDNQTTSPSKRIKQLYPDYDKLIDGIDTLKSLGIHNIMSECKHFRDWINKIKEISCRM